MAIVVSDTSPFRALAHLGRLDRLGTLFDEVFVPPAVDEELLSPPTDLPIVDVRQLAFVQIRAPEDRQEVIALGRDLDRGESEALALAIEMGIEAILMDEAAGRAVARRLGLMPIGVLGLLVRAKARGLIASVGPLLDDLVTGIGFFISPSLRAEVLQLAGEQAPPTDGRCPPP